ncbi:hypothetical protein [Neobacillus mesonae]|uniref:hypothetical protein n=1 Tax=Neobacillus mesonae TaxID=1193713 RepID=UPI00203AA92C|nr:hypothetical protein [Neobacillus mesonae]MCM3568993.1 hypothetical protein [Neobacillus mesonae]
MYIGEKKNFIYVPSIGFIECTVSAAWQKEDILTVDEQVERTMNDPAILKKLQEMHPGCEIVQDGNRWDVIPKKDPYDEDGLD